MKLTRILLLLLAGITTQALPAKKKKAKPELPSFPSESENAHQAIPQPQNQFNATPVPIKAEPIRHSPKIELKPVQGTSFAEIAGEIPETVKILLQYVKNKQKFIDLGAEQYKGILFYGPPGTGKTALARALAGESQVPFFVVKASEISSSWHGETEQNIKDVFDSARKAAAQHQHKMAILFFDEIDGIAGKRRDNDAAHRVSILNTLLEEMDGFGSDQSILVIGSTNRRDALDPAIVRPGRLDNHIYIGLPQEPARKAILELYLRNVKHEYKNNTALLSQFVQQLVEMTSGFSAADLEHIIKESARRSAYQNLNFVATSIIFQATNDLIAQKMRR